MKDSFHFPETFDLTGRVAIVTGASSGLGSSAATALSAAGATVIVAGRRANRLGDLAKTCERIVAHPCDLTNEDECLHLIDRTVRDFDTVDILVNNAGVSNPKRAETESTLEFRTTLELNLVAPFTLSRAAAPYMFEQPNGGSIINVASILGFVGIGRIPQASYAASKGGLVNLTRELAAQWARRGVRVNTIAPGWFSTEMTTDLFGSEDGLNWIAKLTPMARGAEPWELGGAILYLASDASSYMTGATLTVDGGWTAV